MNNTINLFFADGEYHFALPGPRINELQAKTGAGIGTLFNRVLKGVIRDPIEGKLYFDSARADFYYADIVEPIRQGLIGGGRGVVNGEAVAVTPQVAERLMQNYVFDRPLVAHWEHAVSILGACVNGYDPPKKDEPGQDRAAKPKGKKKAGSTMASS